ncbi:MAG: glycosyltransferase family 10 [Planctomycetota bacterium]
MDTPTEKPAPDSTRTVGVLLERADPAGVVGTQCEAYDPVTHVGQDNRIRFVPGTTDADRVLCIGSPVPPGGLGRKTARERWRSLRIGRDRARLERVWDRLRVHRDRIDVLFYEPPGVVSDEAYAVARERADRVFGPDDRATHRITLPVWWSLPESREELLALEPHPSPAGLVCVTSGKRMIPGHTSRLDFIAALRSAEIDFDLFGRGLDAALLGKGPVESKTAVMHGARFALAIENDPSCPGYVTEKLWDALLAWCLPIYHGSDAWEGLIPPEAVIRLPSLDAAGADTVRRTLADADLYERALPAIAAARERILGDTRLVVWYRRDVACGMVDP